MTFANPLTTDTRRVYLTESDNKAFFSTIVTPPRVNKRSGKPNLLILDIKNSQLIAKVTKIPNDKLDDYITQVTSKRPQKDISKTLTLGKIA